MTEPKTVLSASRIKTAQSCSWLYWCKYKLKLPEKGNDGARRGTICHLVFEVLGNPRHRKHYTKIIRTNDIYSSPAIIRLINKHAKAMGVDDPENMELIETMIMTGLGYDFFGAEQGKPTESLSEQDFEIIRNEEGISYKIKGFIDKLFLYKKKKFAKIRDFKTSKSVFNEAEREYNWQDFMYSLAVKSLYPEYKNTQSEFLFLKFPLIEEDSNSGVVKMNPLTDEQLSDFEKHLTKIQKYLDNFSEKSATQNFAKNKGFPTDNTFSGKLMCGFASKPGELKVNGDPKWHCPMKFPFWYIHIYNEDGKFIQSCFEDDFQESMVPQGGSYELKYYEGCPAWK